MCPFLNRQTYRCQIITGNQPAEIWLFFPDSFSREIFHYWWQKIRNFSFIVPKVGMVCDTNNEKSH